MTIGAFGRQIFQHNNLQGTPTLPLSFMRFVDTQAKPGEKYLYAVPTPTSVGLKSELGPPGWKPEANRSRS